MTTSASHFAASFKTWALLGASTAGFAALGACAPTMTHHGYLAYDARPATVGRLQDLDPVVLDDEERATVRGPCERERRARIAPAVGPSDLHAGSGVEHVHVGERRRERDSRAVG